MSETRTAGKYYRGTAAATLADMDERLQQHTPGQLLAAIWGAAVAIAGPDEAWGALANLSAFCDCPRADPDDTWGDAFSALADYAQGHGGTDTGTPAEDRVFAVHAAAPALLVALRGVAAFAQPLPVKNQRGETTTYLVDGHWIETAQAAIAKAEGRCDAG